MKLLLDTHAFLWCIGGSDRLSSHAREQIEDEDNDRHLSVASLWKMAIKVSIGKLDAPLPFTRLVRQHVTGNAIRSYYAKVKEQEQFSWCRGPSFRAFRTQFYVEESPTDGSPPRWLPPNSTMTATPSRLIYTACR